MRKILYYPNININDGVWLRNALLYWDKVSSIMPYNSSDYKVSPELQYLMSTEFFEPTRPDNVVFSELYNDFLNELKEKVLPYNTDRTRSNFTRVHKSKIENVLQNCLLHHSKLSNDILQILEEKNIIIRTTNKQWYLMDEAISNIYMTILAKYLAALDNDDDTIISTDRYNIQNIAYKRRVFSTNYENRKPFIEYSCKALPVPAMDISIDDILKFKVRRQDELKKFRLQLIKLEEALMCCEDYIEIKAKISEFEEEIDLGLKELEQVMKECRWRLRPTVLGALINISVPSILNIAEMYGANIPQSYKGIGIVTGALLGCKITMREIGYYKQNAIRNSPYAYIYHAQENGIIHKF